MSKPTDFQTIDPTALSTVAGGAGRTTSESGSGTDAALMTALSGITESLASVKGSQGSGMSMGDMMMMMVAFGGGGGSGAPVAAAAPQPKAWNYDQATGTWTSTY